MNRKRRLYLKALIQHFHPQKETQLFRFLSEEEREAVGKQDAGRCAALDLFQSGHDALQLIHYSWIPKAVEQLPPSLQLPAIAALPPKLRDRIGRLMQVKSLPETATPLFKLYLTDLLYQQTIHPKIRPRALLPASSFDPLLDLGKRSLVDLIDYLGIHDLASTMRHIVDRGSVQQIMTALSPRKRNYLKLCLRGKNPLKTPDINLNDWDKSAKQLEAKIQRRGLVRLSKALAGQDPSFLWYLTHSLDIGRGKALMRQLSPKPIPGVTPFLEGQIHQILRYMQK